MQRGEDHSGGGRAIPAWAKLFVFVLTCAVAVVAWRITHPPTWPIVNDPPRGTRIIAFGDSITRMPREMALKTYVDFLNEHLERKIENAGVPGNTTTDALKRLDRDVLSRDPRVVILMLGGNDVLKLRRPIEDIVANLHTMIDLIHQRGALVILAGVEEPAIFGIRSGGHFRALARETGCVYVPDVLGPILADGGLRIDFVHPNEKGHRVIATQIKAVAGEYLRR